MKTARIPWTTAVTVLALLAAGCGSSALSRFYTLDSTAKGGGAPIADVAIAVGPVTLPSAVDRPQFVVQVAPNRVDLDEFNRWAGPLDDEIARTVASDLMTLLGTQNVATVPIANFKPAYRVTLDIQRFESNPGSSVLIDAIWNVHSMTGGPVIPGRTVATEKVSGTDRETLAAAHSIALATISTEIAAAIRKNAGGKTRAPAKKK